MAYNYFHVDAFVGAGLSGNPAGVYLLKKPLSAAEMQSIAAEINLPETRNEKTSFRWFNLAGAEGFEPPTIGFGDRCSTNWNYAPAIYAGDYTNWP